MIEIITNTNSENKTSGRSKYASQSDGPGTFLHLMYIKIIPFWV